MYNLYTVRKVAVIYQLLISENFDEIVLFLVIKTKIVMLFLGTDRNYICFKSTYQNLHKKNSAAAIKVGNV